MIIILQNIIYLVGGAGGAGGRGGGQTEVFTSNLNYTAEQRSKNVIDVVECKDVRLHIPNEHGPNLPIPTIKAALQNPNLNASCTSLTTQTFYVPINMMLNDW